MRPASLALGLIGLHTAHAAELVSVEDGTVELRLAPDPGTRAEDLAVAVNGGSIKARTTQRAPGPRRRTELLLHAPNGDVRSTREIALAWADAMTLEDRATVVGEAPAQGPDAFRDAVASRFTTPPVAAEPSSVLAASGGPGLRRILISTSAEPLDIDPVQDGTITHVVWLRQPGFAPDEGPGELGRRVRQTGGSIIVSENIDDARARLGDLPLREPQPVHMRLELCAHEDLPVTIQVEGAKPIIVGKPLPRCDAPAAAEASSAPAVSWLVVTGGVAALGLVVVGGSLLLARGRAQPRPNHSTPPPVEPEAPGRLLAPVDPDAPVRLRILKGRGLTGQEIPLATGSLSVGAASGNDAIVDLPGISGRHARFECFPTGDVFVRDADSANGTWVQGRRLERSERARLRPGDRIALGPSLELELVVSALEEGP